MDIYPILYSPLINWLMMPTTSDENMGRTCRRSNILPWLGTAYPGGIVYTYISPRPCSLGSAAMVRVRAPATSHGNGPQSVTKATNKVS